MPEIPGRDEQILQAIINGTEYTQTPQSRIEYLLLQLKAIIEDGSGVSDYTELENKPSINNVILVGNKSLSDLGIVNPMMIKGRVNSVSDLPQVAETGWVYFVGRSDDADLREYVYTADGEWEFLGYLSIVIDSALSTTSENPVQNKVITNAMVGEKTTGKQYVIDGQTVTAENGAEIFNSYADNKAVGQYSHAEGSETVANGNYSHSEGSGTTASGANSHAEGGGTKAIGGQSHAEGGATTASGIYSHAEGLSTKANGDSTHAEGKYTEAEGNGAHAEGTYYEDTSVSPSVIVKTIAEGNGAHAEGVGCQAENGQGSHAEGERTYTANGSATHVEGFRSKSLYATAAHAEGYQTSIVNGSGNHAEGYSTKLAHDVLTLNQDTTVSSVETAWNTNKFSLAFGSEGAHVEGSDSLALGATSHAEGYRNKASGDYSHAEGQYTTASGDNSHAEGYSTTASGNASHAEGSNTEASGSQSHAEGYSTTASGNTSHAEGSNTEASGSQSHAEGYGTMAVGQCSHAEGQGGAQKNYTSSTSNSTILSAYSTYPFTLAKERASHCEGDCTLALGVSSHAEGYRTKSVSDYSHTEGNGTRTDGVSSHAEGSGTIAYGGSSHAEGGGTTASGAYSHAEGYQTKAASSHQHVQGKYNVEDANDTYAFIIGNGTSTNARHNAFAIDWNGNIYVNGSTTGINVETLSSTVDNLPKPMVFKGSLGTDGTITTLPTASNDNIGFTYKVVTAGTYAGQDAKIGDTFISDGTAWVLIPSGDEPSGTVTNVAITSTDGSATITGSPITSSGTIDISVVTDSALDANSTKPVQNALLSRLFTPISQDEYDAITNKDLPLYFIYD